MIIPDTNTHGYPHLFMRDFGRHDQPFHLKTEDLTKEVKKSPTLYKIEKKAAI
jgi:hypothetical protein